MTELEIDHFAVAAETLEEGVDYVQDTLGVTLSDIGHHPKMGTHNRLLSLGPSIYLEVIAIIPDAAPPRFPRWFDLDRFQGPPRLTNWICRTGNLPAALAHAPDGLGAPMAFERGDYRWQITVPETGVLPFGGAFPALISWESEAHPCAALPDQGCRLRGLMLCHPQADSLGKALAPFPLPPEIQINMSSHEALKLAIETPSGVRELR